MQIYRYATTIALIAFFLSTAGAHGTSFPTDINRDASQAVRDLLHRFWIGGTSGGHFTRVGIALKDKPESTFFAWEHAQATNVLFSYWLATGSPELTRRIGSQWAWLQSIHPATGELFECGAGTPENFASDDTGWNAGFYLETYEMTRDRKALATAKKTLDCAWSRWYDNTLGGGFWYNDDAKVKSAYQAILALDLYWYYRLSNNEIYRSRAVVDDRWMRSKLQRLNAGGGIDDGLYWVGIDRQGKILGENTPYQIAEASSAVFLAGNMAMAVLDAQLYKETHESSYRARAIKTTSGILGHEIDSKGVFLDDRDCFTNGWAMALFVRNVIPILPATLREHMIKVFETSGRAIATKDRAPDGTYGGDWDGPLAGIWERKGNPSSRISTSASAVNVIVGSLVTAPLAVSR